MVRRRLPFEYSKKHGYRCNLDADERHLVRRLVGEVRELLSTADPDDPKMVRLFPPAYIGEENAEANADYRRLMHEELVASRLESLSTIDELLSDDGSSTATPMTEEQLHAMSKSLNDVRLILGSLLGITDDDDDDGKTRRASEETMALYHYLSWLLENAVGALTASLS